MTVKSPVNVSVVFNKKDPEISSAICCEPDSKVGLFVISAKSVEIFAISSAIEDDTSVNDPEICVFNA